MESEKATNETLVSEEEYRNRHHWRETRWRSPTASPLSSLPYAWPSPREVTLDAATKGNCYINSCLRLNEEMKGMDSLATQLSIGFASLMFVKKNSEEEHRYFGLGCE
ncbi:hypothetical protein LOK49_LG13G01150 [Camellia lanceoleosa]|uniref:Uncharacterized protein n=1 Tax=Camellia lanceoleosa TaxID=1840588 RepID=A0ACC0FNZ2_9ERIC|nr:hypothetical protein LOK49_LG13G01150 [Camellia lanceoleosa]